MKNQMKIVSFDYVMLCNALYEFEFEFVTIRNCRNQGRKVIVISGIYIGSFCNEHLDNFLESYRWTNIRIKLRQFILSV